MTADKKCAVCCVPATQLCAGCRLVVYCSRDHQKADWKAGHKGKCKSYELATSAVLGRHLRATREIKKGEIILREMPMLIGPKIASTPLCLGCHRHLQKPQMPATNYYKCSKCTWPLCGVACEESAHHVAECALMASRKFHAKINYSAETEASGKKESAYCVILPLRCMLLKRKCPANYSKLLELEDHLAERMNTPLYKVLRANLITFVKTILDVDEWTEQDIMRVTAILDTNSFEVRQPGNAVKVRAVYPMAAMMSHDCVPNARHIFDDQMQIVFFAKQTIAKGEVISISYTQPLKSTLMRRIHLQQAKCFLCTCQRCKDPEELGTYAGATICDKCKIGKIVSTDPLNNDAAWQCLICKRRKTVAEVLQENARLQKEIESLDKSTPNTLEEFLHKYRVLLHDNNTHILQVKYALTQLYGNAKGFQMDEINDYALQRKIELCEELLKVADIVDGGWSLFRGNLLLDLQQAIVVQAKRAYAGNKATQEQTETRLREAMQLLLEAVDILGVDQDVNLTLSRKVAELTAEVENIKTPAIF